MRSPPNRRDTQYLCTWFEWRCSLHKAWRAGAFLRWLVLSLCPNEWLRPERAGASGLPGPSSTRRYPEVTIEKAQSSPDTRAVKTLIFLPCPLRILHPGTAEGRAAQTQFFMHLHSIRISRGSEVRSLKREACNPRLKVRPHRPVGSLPKVWSYWSLLFNPLFALLLCFVIHHRRSQHQASTRCQAQIMGLPASSM